MAQKKIDEQFEAIESEMSEMSGELQHLGLSVPLRVSRRTSVNFY